MSRTRRTDPGPYVLSASLVPDRITDPSSYPYTIPAIRAFRRLDLHPKVTFLVGENGSGKSTLLEAIAVAYGLNAEGGGRNFRFETKATHSRLEEAIHLSKSLSTPKTGFFLRAESFYNVATTIETLGLDLRSYGGVGPHECSHGESFFSLFQYRFLEHGFFLMDEPEAALSPRRQMEFLALLHCHVKDGSQFIIATHSPILMAYPDSWIYQFGPSGPTRIAYEETEHFSVTKGFLGNHKGIVAKLMADPDANDRVE